MSNPVKLRLKSFSLTPLQREKRSQFLWTLIHFSTTHLVRHMFLVYLRLEMHGSFFVDTRFMRLLLIRIVVDLPVSKRIPSRSMTGDLFKLIPALGCIKTDKFVHILVDWLGFFLSSILIRLHSAPYAGIRIPVMAVSPWGKKSWNWSLFTKLLSPVTANLFICYIKSRAIVCIDCTENQRKIGLSQMS